MTQSLPILPPNAGESLADRLPELAAQWHSELNGGLMPTNVVPGSSRKVWWKCDGGPDHEWQAFVYNRSKGSGCPFCSNKRSSITNCMLNVPHLVAEWHPFRNGALRPQDVVPGTNKKIWWKCDKGPDHEWVTSGANRISGKGCPFCAGQKVSITNSIAGNPLLRNQWHPIRNGSLQPEELVVGTNKKIWWKCEAGPDHEWQATGNRRMMGNGCPFCHGASVSVTNCLATRNPELAQQWHPTLNGDLRPEDVIAATNKKIWWKCDKGPDHEWQAVCNSRLRGCGCPFCSGRSASVTNNLKNYPELAAQWHPTRNNGLGPEDVPAGTSKPTWWKCDKGPDHEWKTSASIRMRGVGCPFCAGKRVSVTNSIARIPLLLNQWHPKLNGDLRPEDVVAGTAKRLWWKCNKGHEWRAGGAKRMSGQGCPSCATSGYNNSKIGTLYLLRGSQWGKVGVSNTLSKRLAQHKTNGIFGPCEIAIEFTDGSRATLLEKNVCAFIAELSCERAPKTVSGHTESFPMKIFEEVKVELLRLLRELPEDLEWQLVNDPQPKH